jgi:hypothetical protein
MFPVKLPEHGFVISPIMKFDLLLDRLEKKYDTTVYVKYLYAWSGEIYFVLPGCLVFFCVRENSKVDWCKRQILFFWVKTYQLL